MSNGESFIARVQRIRALGLSLRAAFVILCLNLGAILFEGVGIAMLLPIFEFIEKGGDLQKLAASGGYWTKLIEISQSFSVPLTLPLLLGASFCAILCRQLFTYLRIVYNSRVLFESIHQLRRRTFALSLRATTVLQQASMLGEAVNDIALELPKAINALYGTVHFISRVLLVVVYLVGLVLLAPWMTVVSLGVLVITGLALTGIMRQTNRASTEIVRANRAFSSFLIERLRSLRLIRLSGTEMAEVENLSRLSAQQRDIEIRLREIAAKLDAAMEPTAVFVGFVVLYLGFAHFNMPVAALGLFMLVITRLLPVAKDAIGAYQTILSNWKSLMVIDERMQAITSQREPKGGARQMTVLAHGIRYEGVSFAYTADVPALRNVTCELPARRMTALVGPSGSGKSTFIDLLPRLRDPDSGVIRLDGMPLQEFSVPSLRANIAYVPQSPQIFNVTAAEHIRYGRADASDADVREAARLAGAADFIAALPEGYDTLLGENGQRLSGGQRQRLDIARALVRQASILILDEPTSQLDADSEQLFRDALHRIRKETKALIIIVAHRLSTVAEADRILVFESGTITDSGTHKELVQRGGWYAQAFSKQHIQPAEEKMAVGA